MGWQKRRESGKYEADEGQLVAARLALIRASRSFSTAIVNYWAAYMGMVGELGPSDRQNRDFLTNLNMVATRVADKLEGVQDQYKVVGKGEADGQAYLVSLYRNGTQKVAHYLSYTSGSAHYARCGFNTTASRGQVYDGVPLNQDGSPMRICANCVLRVDWYERIAKKEKKDG